MQQRLNQHRHHHPPHQPRGGDLRDKLNQMREQRLNDEIAGIPPAEDSYIHNMPRPRREKPVHKPVGKVEWDEGKAINIKIELSEAGGRMYKMDKDDALNISSTSTNSNEPEGTLHHKLSQIIKNEHEPGMKSRGRGSYRGPGRGRGSYRGRGGYRGGRRPKFDKNTHKDSPDGASSTSSGVTEQFEDGCADSQVDHLDEEALEGIEGELEDGTEADEYINQAGSSLDDKEVDDLRTEIENVKINAEELASKEVHCNINETDNKPENEESPEKETKEDVTEKEVSDTATEVKQVVETKSTPVVEDKNALPNKELQENAVDKKDTPEVKKGDSENIASEAEQQKVEECESTTTSEPSMDANLEENANKGNGDSAVNLSKDETKQDDK